MLSTGFYTRWQHALVCSRARQHPSSPPCPHPVVDLVALYLCLCAEKGLHTNKNLLVLLDLWMIWPLASLHRRRAAGARPLAPARPPPPLLPKIPLHATTIRGMSSTIAREKQREQTGCSALGLQAGRPPGGPPGGSRRVHDDGRCGCRCREARRIAGRAATGSSAGPQCTQPGAGPGLPGGMSKSISLPSLTSRKTSTPFLLPRAYSPPELKYSPPPCTLRMACGGWRARLCRQMHLALQGLSPAARPPPLAPSRVLVHAPWACLMQRPAPWAWLAPWASWPCAGPLAGFLGFRLRCSVCLLPLPVPAAAASASILSM